MSKFDELVKLKKDSSFLCQNASSRALLVPDLGARVFIELEGITPHRIDIENVREPNRPFNNYGGNNFWPAPEGGKYGFNYKDDNWYVQPSINDEPFLLDSHTADRVKAIKETVLENRKGVKFNVIMQREFSESEVSNIIQDLDPVASFSYTVEDTINVLNNISSNDAILGSWTLEQFNSSPSIHSFVKVKEPMRSINFDFYEAPHNKITYGSNGFFYKTDSQQRGQIGIKKSAKPEYTGFYDLVNKLVCIREVVGIPTGSYFNIADNEQTEGPFSAADIYSIFNGDPDLGFFELETIGGATIDQDKLKGSKLVSKSSFGLFEDTAAIERLISQIK